ncbi:hypothetical protein M885DRAFT_531195 [Pelagophyceae sp. CCMP2097]|nr:hypothetical protein M885DRAFT_531195 [Pelagophyceae sp. CCMP2097]
MHQGRGCQSRCQDVGPKSAPANGPRFASLPGPLKMARRPSGFIKRPRTVPPCLRRGPTRAKRPPRTAQVPAGAEDRKDPRAAR